MYKRSMMFWILLTFLTEYKLQNVDALTREGPTFIVEPPGRVDFANDTGAVVSCSAQGNPPPVITWTKENGEVVTNVPGLRYVRPDGSLVFTQFGADEYKQDIHDAIYRCVASNSIGKVGSVNVRVKGVVLQSFKVEVYDDNVVTGNTGVLRCRIPDRVKEYVTVTSWLQDESFIIRGSSTSSRYSVFPSGEFHVRRVTVSDVRKTFRCRVRNRLTGETLTSSSSGRLVVTDALRMLPRLTDFKLHLAATEGRMFELPCAAQSSPLPIYEWYKHVRNGLSQITDGKEYTFLDGTLLIHTPSSNDSGKYRCIAKNILGSESADTELVVLAPLSAKIHPRHQIVDVGETALFSCNYSGFPILSLEWTKDNKPFQWSDRVRPVGDKILRIYPVKSQDRGMYQCFVRNEIEAAQAATELKIGDDEPIFQETFQDQILKPGPPISIKCVAQGNPLPQITWLLDGMPLPTSPRFSKGDYVNENHILTSYVNVSSIRSEDGGNYKCIAKNDVGVIEHSGKIQIYGPPFVRSMKNISVLEEETLELQCPVGGYPIDSIVWEKDGSKLPYNQRQKVYSNGTLVVESVDRATDEGKYVCQAKDKKGRMAKSDVYISVLVRPVIQSFSLPTSIRFGQRFNLMCVVTKGDPPVNISWLKNGQKLADFPNIKEVRVTDFSSTLVFDSVRPEYHGDYTCLASNSAGTSSQTATMIIHVPPSWKIEPNDVAVTKDKNTIINCKAEGFPFPTIHWKKAKDTDTPGQYSSIISNSRLHVSDNGTLIIYKSQKNDAGFYVCEANNGVTPSISKVIRLDVNEPPAFKSRFQVETAQKGILARLKCEAKGDNPIAILWLKDNQRLDIRELKRYELKETQFSDSKTSHLFISSPDRSDSGMFSCLASNAFGHDETNLQLILQDSWHQKSSNFSVHGNDTTSTLSTLFPSTNYEFRIFAVNKLGSSHASQVVHVKTDEEAPGGPPREVEVEAIGSQSIKVTWKPPTEQLLFGALKGYYVGYRIAGSLNTYVYQTLKVGDPDFREKIHLTNLRRFTKYAIVVQAFNSKGTGPASAELIVRTLENDPPAQPTLDILASTSSEVHLLFRTKDNIKNNQLSGYLLYYKGERAEWNTIAIPPNSIDYKVTSLKCGSRYLFYLIPFNSAGKGEPSETISVKTKGVAPVAPSKHLLLSVNSTWVNIHLAAWSDGGCPISYFSIRYKEETDKSWKTYSDHILSSQSDVFLPNLTPRRHYLLQITAKSQAGTNEAEYSIVTPPTTIGDSKSSVEKLGKEHVPLYLDLSIVLPVVVSLMVVIVIMTVVFIILRKHHSPESSNNDCVTYNRRKLQSKDALNMITFNHNLKEGLGSMEDGATIYYPEPYATTKLPSHEENQLNESSTDEPLYATVKRTPRPPRSGAHVYNYPVRVSSDAINDNCSSTSEWKETPEGLSMEEPNTCISHAESPRRKLPKRSSMLSEK
ncbi:cell adhesion molecule Dscam1-like isoform X2 [Tachypleus tridentatus]|uniref:cell adhesion molecule Dscam1-like isoform X2 n=1 Tax=Tachypleus tridentatus TaxID=6853 RepID=UPI003FD492DC